MKTLRLVRAAEEITEAKSPRGHELSATGVTVAYEGVDVLHDASVTLRRGLAAPHAARALVGRQHARVVPAQFGAGLVTAVIGTPYFLQLLVRGRR